MEGNPVAKLVASTLLAVVVAAGLATPTWAPQKAPTAGHSSFYRDFDPDPASGICQNLSTRAGGGSHPHLTRVRPEGHEFKIFHGYGESSPDQVSKVLRALKAHLTKLARDNKAVTATEPRDTIADRPMYLLHMNMFPPETWVQPDSLRGFYFTYKEGDVQGVVDVLAVRVDPDVNKNEWRIVGAVHEPAAP